MPETLQGSLARLRSSSWLLATGRFKGNSSAAFIHRSRFRGDCLEASMDAGMQDRKNQAVPRHGVANESLSQVWFSSWLERCWPNRTIGLLDRLTQGSDPPDPLCSPYPPGSLPAGRAAGNRPDRFRLFFEFSDPDEKPFLRSVHPRRIPSFGTQTAGIPRFSRRIPSIRNCFHSGSPYDDPDADSLLKKVRSGHCNNGPSSAEGFPSIESLVIHRGYGRPYSGMIWSNQWRIAPEIRQVQ